jgi:uncharacterized membrane protein
MTTTQLAGHGLTTIVGGLTPPMLGILLLICAGLAASTYFLDILITGQQGHLASLLVTQERQINMVLKTHDREFDTLMALIRDQMKQPPPPEPMLPSLVPAEPEPPKGKTR